MRSFIFLLSFAAAVPGIYAQGFSSLSEFWNAPPAKVDQRLNARPLNLSRSLDRKVRSSNRGPPEVLQPDLIGITRTDGQVCG